MSEASLSQRQIAHMIDISAVQAPHGETEIRDLVHVARGYGFGAIHVLPAWVSFTRALLGSEAGIALGAPVGFPSGGNHTAIKRAEAIQMVADGVDELDMMMNIGKLRSGDEGYVLDELRAVISAVRVPVKVIIETHYLSEDQIRCACDLCVQANAAYVKTSTGWAESGATLANVALIAEAVHGRIGIKAAGGIRDLDTLLRMYTLGARRFGINVQAAIAIAEECQRHADGVVALP